VLLAVLQGLGIAFGFESIPGLVADPGWLFVITTALTLTAGTMFLVWLGAQITSWGVGNGWRC
jgi:preprotein translocase subunit SecY